MEGCKSALFGIVGRENVTTDKAELFCYSFDASIHSSAPDVVVRPGSAEEVSKIVRYANKKKIPVVPRGAGTALCGHSLPWSGGITLDMTRMSHIVETHVEDLYVVVGPGIVYSTLNAALKPFGFFFPPEPGSADVCTIGGMVAVNASGTKAIKYGATRDYVLGLEVVLPNGRIIQTGSRTIKNSSGYQLHRLFVGSEGTLGVITEIKLKVAPLPSYVSTALAAYEDLEAAGRTISNLIKGRMLPAALEIMDKACIQAVNKSMRLDLPEVNGLVIIEFDGHRDTVKDDMRRAEEVCRKENPTLFTSSDDPVERERLWAGRKAVLPSMSRLKGGQVSTSLADDMIVPISKIPQLIHFISRVARKQRLVIGTYGHCGDGNLHAKVLFNVRKRDAWKRAWKACQDIYKACIGLGGSLSGEHGIGFTRAPFMGMEHKTELDLMRVIKRAIDPNNIMNPGKLSLDFTPKTFVTRLRYPVES
jgi:glycolate oxidase